MRLLTVVIMILSFACGSGPDHKSESNRPGKKDMEQLNRFLVQKDRERIENYIERKNLSMKELDSGLWYQILSEGEGPLYKSNDRIVFEYECSLLDGESCYSSDQTGPREIILGKSELETGLDQGLRLLRPGGQAIFIIPPFLAYGLKGDGKKIPARAIIVYNISTLRAVNANK